MQSAPRTGHCATVSRFLKTGWVWLAMATGLLLLGLPALGIHTVRGEATPLSQPSHATLDALLQRVVRDGRVDYEALRERAETLEAYAVTLQDWGPEQQATHFPDPQSRLAYYVNAYNALTLWGVIRHWPIGSVHDVRGWLEPRPGFGFFWAQHFMLDGRRINLYDLEHELLREGFDDARIHAAINCASTSCPPLASRAYLPATVEAQLDAASTRFASTPHVRVDDAARTVHLSAIYDWFRADFEQHAAKLGEPATVLNWVAHYSQQAKAVRAAIEQKYSVQHDPYDWSLNRTGSARIEPGS